MKNLFSVLITAMMLVSSVSVNAQVVKMLRPVRFSTHAIVGRVTVYTLVSLDRINRQSNRPLNLPLHNRLPMIVPVSHPRRLALDLPVQNQSPMTIPVSSHHRLALPASPQDSSALAGVFPERGIEICMVGSKAVSKAVPSKNGKESDITGNMVWGGLILLILVGLGFMAFCVHDGQALPSSPIIREIPTSKTYYSPQKEEVHVWYINPSGEVSPTL